MNYENIVKMLKGDKFYEGLEELKLSTLSDKTLEKGLFLNGMSREEAEYIVWRSR